MTQPDLDLLQRQVMEMEALQSVFLEDVLLSAAEKDTLAAAAQGILVFSSAKERRLMSWNMSGGFVVCDGRPWLCDMKRATCANLNKLWIL
ncbi:hypothetical protein WJX75_005931 [Coccomyxa subellipsoidea]|uniref:Uncharacterized protein n=1 Tax=Coccomyxa subellipsoidea TaxID=248742 RepID=A0ABR2Z3A9_9CHLO